VRASIPVWLLPCLALCAGCPPPPAPTTSHGGDGGRTSAPSPGCSEPLPEEQPALTAAPPLPAPDSRIALTVRLPLERLRHEIERRVPVELAAAGGQNVGSVGRLSYSVRRGAVAVRLEQDTLLVEIPVTGYAEVCLPIGSACPRVSSCSPALTMTAAIPLALGPDFSFGASKVSVQITRGCVIAGIDATSRFSGAAQQNAAAAGRRIDQTLPSLQPELQAAWAGLGQPIPVGNGACLRGYPQRLVQAPATLDGDDIAFHVGIFAIAYHEPICPAPRETAPPQPLPAVEHVPALEPLTELAVAENRPLAELSRALGRLEPPAGLASLSLVELRAIATPAGARIATQLQLGGEHCGQAWLTAQPRASSDGAQITLAGVQAAPGQPGREAALASLGLDAWFGSHVSFPATPALGPEALEAVRQTLEQAARLRSPDTTVTLGSSKSTTDAPAVGAETLVTVEHLRGTLTATLR
jgi:hypothetical protein